MSQQVLALTNSPNQTVTVTLSVDGAPLTLQLTVSYNEIADYWVIAIADSNGNPIIGDVPLLTGNYPACNILKQYAYLDIGSAYVLNTTGKTLPDYPNSIDLGDWEIVWGNTPLS